MSSKKTNWLTILGFVLALAACAPEPPRSLVFISFDTTRRDHLSVYGYSRATTPTLERLAQQGTLFQNAVAQQNRTLPSHASMFTGLYPHGHQSFTNKHILPESQTTLAEILSDAGFRTAAFVSGYTLRSDWGLDQGFELYDDEGKMSRWGEATSAEAREWLGGLDPRERFFLFLHLYDTHGPYRTPEDRVAFQSQEPGPRLTNIPDYQKLKGPDGAPLQHLNDYVDRYDTLIRYQDDVVGRLMDEIDLETTVVVIVADHGETLGERTQTLNHGAALFDEEIRIPLLFVGSGVSAGRIETTVETVDLLPTILEVLAVPLPPGDPLHGRSLVSLLDGDEGGEPSDRVVFASSVAEPNRYLDRGYELDTRRQIYAARAGDWKLIVYPNVSDDYVELYDLREDPMERRNVAAQQPEVRDRLLAALERWNPDYREPISLVNLSDDERERLRALGYIR